MKPPSQAHAIPPLAPPEVSRRQLAAALVGTLLLAFAFFSPARQLADPELDASNYASYAYFTAKGFQYGPEVVPLAGPYGFVPYGFLYAGHLYWKRLPLELLTKLAFGGLVMWLVLRADLSRVLRWIWIPLILVMAPMVEDLPYDLAVLFTGLALIHCQSSLGRGFLPATLALSAFLALLTLFKGTQVLLALATLGLLGLQALLQRDWRRFPWLLGSFFVALLFWLSVAGQSPSNLPVYVRGMLELSSGYNLAMGLEEPAPVFWCGLGSLLALGSTITLLFAPRWRDPGAVCAGLLLAGFSFIKWKHGFVRADGHVLIFFHYVCVAAPAAWLFSQSSSLTPCSPRWRRPAALCAGTAFALAVWTNGAAPFSRHLWYTEMFGQRLADTWRQLLHPSEEKQRLDAELRRRREAYGLSAIQEKVAGHPVDFFGTELGYLMLNGLNYRPRPMGGGTFSVFSPWLQDRNRDFIADPSRRPDFFVVHPVTIDERFPGQDDPGTFHGLTQLYAPVLTEQGMVLFALQSKAAGLKAPVAFQTVRLNLEAHLEIPEIGAGEMLYVSFRLPLTPAGRLRAFLYKPPLLFLDLDGTNITAGSHRRLVPNLATRPMPLNPLVEDAADVIGLYAPGSRRSARSLRLHSPHPGLWAQDQFEATFYRTPRPPALPADQAAALLGSLRHPIVNVEPREILPVGAPLRRFSGLPVQMLDPPGCIRLPLSGDEREVSFKIGLDAAAYQKGETDGVDFVVDLERPGQTAQTLFRRWLRPRENPGDRGTHSHRVMLPPFPAGSTLALRTEFGADNNGAWDWGYYTAVRVRRGPFTAAQFPGFSRLPDHVEAGMAGALSQEGREIFMLNPPGTLTFPLSGREQRVQVVCGLLPGAYTAGGHSDGVRLRLLLRQQDGAEPVAVGERIINPRDLPADRGDLSISFAFASPTGNAQLILAVDPGPAGNGAWDWFYLAGVNFD